MNLKRTPKNIDVCDNCFHWDEEEDTEEDWGSCHRYPHAETVRYAYWCGEFKRESEIIDDE